MPSGSGRLTHFVSLEQPAFPPLYSAPHPTSSYFDVMTTPFAPFFISIFLFVQLTARLFQSCPPFPEVHMVSSTLFSFPFFALTRVPGSDVPWFFQVSSHIRASVLLFYGRSLRAFAVLFLASIARSSCLLLIAPPKGPPVPDVPAPDPSWALLSVCLLVSFLFKRSCVLVPVARSRHAAALLLACSSTHIRLLAFQRVLFPSVAHGCIGC